MTAGELLKKVRDRNRISQVELARRAQTAQTTISRWERDERSPTVAQLQKLLGVMGEELELSARRIPAKSTEDPDSPSSLLY